MSINWTLTVMIEGLVFDADDSVRPSALSFVPERTEAAPEGRVTGRWHPCLTYRAQGEKIVLSGQSWSPLKGSVAVQTMEISINAAYAGELMSVRDYFLARPQPVAIIAFGETITPTTVSFDVTMLDGSTADATISAGAVLYIGREVFRVASCTGDTVTVEAAIPQSFIYPGGGADNDLGRSTDGVELGLGHIGSRIVTHTGRTSGNQPPTFDDDRVYLQNPVLRGRRAWLHRSAIVGGELIEQCLGQYVIGGEDTITKSADGTAIRVPFQSLAGSFSSYQFNTRCVQFQYEFARFPGSSQVLARGGIAPTSNPADSVWKRVGVFVDLMQEGDRVAAVVGEIQLLQGLTFGGDAVEVYELTGRLDDYLEATDGRRLKRFNEVFTSYPYDIVTADGGSQFTITGTSHPLYSTERPDPNDPTATDPGILRHPLHMWLAHARGLSSNLPTHWTLPIGRDGVDVAGVLALARGAFGHITEWPGVVKGGDGKAFNGLDWMDEAYLVPLGCGRATDQFGRLTVRSLLSPSDTLVTIGDANVGPTRPYSLPMGVTADMVEAVTGRGLSDAPIITLTSLDSYSPSIVDQRIIAIEINADGALAAIDQADPVLALERPGIQHVRAVVNSIGAMLSKSMGQYQLDVNLSSLNTMDPAFVQPLIPGTFFRLAIRAMDNPETGALEDGLALNGLVMEHKWSTDFTTQAIRVMIYPYAQRRIGYALLVTGVTPTGGSGYDLTFDADQSILPDGGASLYTSPTGATFATDLSTLAHAVSTYSAAKALLCDQYMAAKATVDITGTGAVVSASVPVVGDWVVLADLGDGNTGAEGVFAYFGRDRYGV
jgi:hypothetical protein